jgi:hypothetical protein
MSRHLVLVHGRSQQDKDADDLKRVWMDALEEGLAVSGLTLPVPESDVHFPYYGDTLIDFLEGKPPDEVAEIVIKGASDAELAVFVAEAMEEVRRKLGVTEAEIAARAGDEVVEKGPLNWQWVQTVMKVIDSKTEHGSGLSIFLATRDVYHYLVDKATKDEIDGGVAAAIPPGVETVVVGHSLGSVVTHSLLKTLGESLDLRVPQLVTVGSPLGIKRISGSIKPPRWPSRVSRWFNARDPRDVVALYPLTPDHFVVGDDAPGIVDKSDVDNTTSNRHGISGYLSDPDVARAIYDGLVG